jgi:hypothetical protein
MLEALALELANTGPVHPYINAGDRSSLETVELGIAQGIGACLFDGQ